ncbi:hypothetical protein IFT48_02615 [Pseudomonas fluorescens]|uniref:hypothetical protein n=1 Tax=Pseudomonas fluorescens TaxID=294 RepID=UPI001930A694|nr:hypothetical protein [Pseudomonas fluorescens]MBD8088858.1 hypothetical protein [Pseudomonas fluorescens]
MHYSHSPNTLNSNVLSYTSKDSQAYWSRVATYLMQRERHGEKHYAERQLFEGPLESHAALFYIAGCMGLIPMKDGKGMDGAPVLYAMTEPPEGAQVQKLKTAEEFVLIVGHLLTHEGIRKYLTNSLLEFHDFLKLADPPQADRFMGDLAKALFQRTGDLSPLLATAGEDEDMGKTLDYPGTLRKAMEEHGVFEKGLDLLKPSDVTRALLRFGWNELRIKAPQKGRDASFGQDLGL